MEYPPSPLKSKPRLLMAFCTSMAAALYFRHVALTISLFPKVIFSRKYPLLAGSTYESAELLMVTTVEVEFPVP